MGQTTLNEFRNRLGVVLGETSMENEIRDVWINAAYFEVVGAIVFDKFKEEFELVFAADSYTLAVPAGTLAILSLFNLADEDEIIYTNPETFKKFIRGDSFGVVRNWTQIGETIHLWDTPTVETTLSGIRLKEPDKLTLPASVTEIPTTWDEAVYLLAAEKALLDLEQDDRSAKYADRAINYMRSRLSEGDYTMRRQGEGLNIISSERELRAMRRF